MIVFHEPFAAKWLWEAFVKVHSSRSAFVKVVMENQGFREPEINRIGLQNQKV